MAKFKVDGWVGIKGTKQDEVKFHILEVLEQSCEAGTQVHYTGRVFLKPTDRLFPKSEFHPATKEARYREVELEELGKKNVVNPLRYELTKDKQGLLAYYGKRDEEFYHIHSNELSDLEKWIHKNLLEAHFIVNKD